MDWTDFDADDQSTVVLSLITGLGRALPLVWLTVYKADLTGRRDEFEDTCLRKLKEALPDGVRATIVADRGFADVRLMELLTELGMDYVIRFRADTFVSAADGETRKAAEWVGARGRAKNLVDAGLTRKRFKVGACVFVKAKGMKDGWHLAASDGTKSAREIVDIYASRWSIETNIRDTKDIRFGMGMSELRIADPNAARPPAVRQRPRGHAHHPARRGRRKPRNGQVAAHQHDQAPHPLAVPPGIDAILPHPQHAGAKAEAAHHKIQRINPQRQYVVRCLQNGLKMRGWLRPWARPGGPSMRVLRTRA
jgi:hypothetical protein